MSNYMDEDNAGEFRDIPEEAGGDQYIEPPIESTRRILPPSKPRPLPQASEPMPVPQPVQEVEAVETEDEEDDYTDVLSDARLRLEQGRLYELVMNNSLFTDSDCDPKAIKNVEREIRNFAKERMEIMLGMKQEVSKGSSFSLESFPFNALEVEALRALASAATKGASANAEPFSPSAEPTKPRKPELKKMTLRSNSRPQPPPPQVQAQARPTKPLPTKPAAPIKRPAVNELTQRILAEEGVTLDQINEVYDPNREFLTPEQLANLTAEEIVERNNRAAQRYRKTVSSPKAIPMPSQERIEEHYSQIANSRHENANQSMQNVINNLLQQKKQ